MFLRVSCRGFQDGIACALAEPESCERRRTEGARSTNGERKPEERAVQKREPERQQRIAAGLGKESGGDRGTVGATRRLRAKQRGAMGRSPGVWFPAVAHSQTRVPAAQTHRDQGVEYERQSSAFAR